MAARFSGHKAFVATPERGIPTICGGLPPGFNL